MRTRVVSFEALTSSRWYRRSLWAGAVFLVYLLVGFFVLPPVIRSQLIKRLPALTKRQASMRQVKFNPLALSLTIRGLSLTEQSGEVFASWEELYVNFQLSSLIRLAWTFDEIGLLQPYGHISLAKDGRFNFANLLEESAPPPRPADKDKKPGDLPTVHVGRLHVDEGSLVFDDATHRLPLHTEFKPINVSLTNLTTRVGKDSVYSFVASSDSGRRFAWTGNLTVQPFRSRGHFELAGGEFKRWTPILRDFARAQFQDGNFAVRADYALATGTNGFAARLTNGFVEITDFKLGELEAGETLTTLPSLRLGPMDFDLQTRALHVADLSVEGLSQVIRLEKDGKLNLLKLPDLPEAKKVVTNVPSTTPAAPWMISLDSLSFKDGAVVFTDLSRPTRFETTLKPIQIELTNFSLTSGSNALYQFSLGTEAKEKVAGIGSFCVVPFRSAGEIKLENLHLPKYQPYYDAVLHGKVPEGKLDVGANYQFAGSSNAPILSVSNATLALTGFQLQAADTGETVASIPLLAVSRTEADLTQQRVTLGLVKSSGGVISLRQSKDGKINLLGLAKARTNAPAEMPAPASAQSPWTAFVKEIAFDGYTVQIEDQKPTTPASFKIDQLALDVKGVSTVSNAPITANLSLRVNEAGTIAVAGEAKISPATADLQITVKDLDLRPLQPYLNDQIQLAIHQGRFSSEGRAHYASPGPQIAYTGGFRLTDLATTDRVIHKDLVKWADLSVTGIDFSLPGGLQVREVKWQGLDTSLVIGPDQRSNLQMLFPDRAINPPPTQAAKAAPAAAAGSTAPSFPIGLETLALQNAGLHFVDESIDPTCAFDVQQLSGTLKGLSSQPQTAATVDLRGKTDPASSFSISGEINPLAEDLQLDLFVTFTNTDLTPFSTYLEKYAGYPLNKGKLTMGLHYDIQRKQLKADNKFLVDRFTLGPRNGSTNATSLPVKLAVALLKDRNGQIHLDVPLSGRTDDPQFRVAPVILKVIVNLMVKAATSPFSLLGALVGGGEELSFVAFEPGQATIAEAETQKLQKLVKALHERPALNLEIAGAFDREQDGAALARAKLEQQLYAARLRELATGDTNAVAAAEPRLEPEVRLRLLQQLYLALSTNQAPGLIAAPVGAGTNLLPPSARPLPATNAPLSTTNNPGRSAELALLRAGYKGAKDLLFVAVERTATPLQSTAASAPAVQPTVSNAVTVGAQEMEAALVAALPITLEEQRDLARQRAQAVQALILQNGQVEADRLFIVTPKTGASAAKNQPRVTLSLN